MGSVGEEDIDNEILIAEISTRPALFNKMSPDYGTAATRKLMWEEVCAKVFYNVWDGLTAEEQQIAVLEVQKRWKNLRTSFGRELRIQKRALLGQAIPKRRKYIYFNKLLFLMPSMKHKNVKQEYAALEEEDDNSQAGSDYSLPQSDSKDPIREIQNDNDEMDEELEHSVSRPVLRSSQHKNQTYEEPFSEIVKNNKQSRPNVETVDQEKNFALSLIPMLKSLPLSTKLEIQIQILQLFKDAFDNVA